MSESPWKQTVNETWKGLLVTIKCVYTVSHEDLIAVYLYKVHCMCEQAYIVLQSHEYEQKLTVPPFTAIVPLIEVLAGHSQCCLCVEESDVGKWNEMVGYHKGLSQCVVIMLWLLACGNSGIILAEMSCDCHREWCITEYMVQTNEMYVYSVSRQLVHDDLFPCVFYGCFDFSKCSVIVLFSLSMNN